MWNVKTEDRISSKEYVTRLNLKSSRECVQGKRLEKLSYLKNNGR